MPRKARGRGKSALGYRRKKRSRTMSQSPPLTVCDRLPSDSSMTEMAQTFQPCPDFFLADSCYGDVSFVDEINEIQDHEGSFADVFYLVADKIIQLSPTDDTDSLYSQRMKEIRAKIYVNMITSLRDEASEIQKNTNFTMLPSNCIKFVQVYDSDNPGVKCAVGIEPETFLASVFVHRQPLNEAHDLWNHMPKREFQCSDDVILLLKSVSDLSVCVGNPDTAFQSLETGTNAFREQDFGAVCGIMTYAQTIRHNQCERLVSGIRCPKCVDHRGALRKKKSLEAKKLSSPNDKSTMNMLSKRTPHSKMSKEQLCEKVNALQKERYSMTAEILSLKKKLQKAIHKSGKMTEGTILYPRFNL